mmetsp:Transcript_21894/g.45685  ORF Transcript_21894/g.45685 Transcript_21894/m.45685 type:complete len:175 (-) Transcript_21894:126-650(-)
MKAAFSLFFLLVTAISGFSVVVPNKGLTSSPSIAFDGASIHNGPSPLRRKDTHLFMSSRERTRTTKKGTLVKDRTETKAEEDKKKEEMWRVVLHNDEVHTFNYVIRSLTKVIGTLDRKAAFEICVQTHGVGKATITKSWKKQAEQFCLGLQRQGLTVSISPDEDFDGGHSGGGL